MLVYIIIEIDVKLDARALSVSVGGFRTNCARANSVSISISRRFPKLLNTFNTATATMQTPQGQRQTLNSPHIPIIDSIYLTIYPDLSFQSC